MSKKDSTVSKAEQYRKERKARIAKSAKKSARKNSSGNTGSEKIISRVITVVFSVAVVVGIAALLCNNFGVFQRMNTVYKVGDTSISEAELTYQIRYTYSSLVSTSQQYTQYYGYDIFGFDTTKSPDAQKYTADDKAPEDEEEAKDYEGDKYDTWMDYITGSSISSIQQRKALCAEAKANNYKLDDEALKELEDSIDELEASVLENSASSGTTTSLKGYLKNAYGNGMTLGLFRQIQEETTLAQKYAEYKQEKYYDSYSASDIKAIYEEDTSEYNVIDMRSYSINFSKEESKGSLTKAQAKKRADEMVASITDEASFNKLAQKYAKKDSADDTTYDDANATLSKNTSAATFDSYDSEGNIRKWAYANGRKAGDVKSFELANSYYVLYIVKPAHETYAYNSRHILFGLEDTEKATDKDWDNLLKEAQAVLDEWKKGEATEESFAALAKEHSTDTGSAENGGLYEDTAPGEFVSEYEDWCLDSKRKEGDVGIVKSTHGYHIIYFISVNDTPIWNDTIRSDKASEDYNAYLEKALEKPEYTNNLNNKKITACEADSSDYIRLLIEQQSSSTSYK